MITDKNGKDVTLKSILDSLVGTDDLDQAKAVMDFSVYRVLEDGTPGDPVYYLVAAKAIVTQVSLLGPFTMVEVDFRNTGIRLLQQVASVVNRFHADINTENIIMLSTVTSLNREATHIMSLADPLICVRGYSEEGEGSTLLQLVYSTANVGFSASEVDYDRIEAEIGREITEIESARISAEAAAAGQEGDTGESEMQQMFRPDFVPDFDDEEPAAQQSVRVSGPSRENVRVDRTDATRIKGVRETKEDNSLAHR